MENPKRCLDLVWVLLMISIMTPPQPFFYSQAEPFPKYTVHIVDIGLENLMVGCGRAYQRPFLKRLTMVTSTLSSLITMMFTLVLSTGKINIRNSKFLIKQSISFASEGLVRIVFGEQHSPSLIFWKKLGKRCTLGKNYSFGI